MNELPQAQPGQFWRARIWRRTHWANETIRLVCRMSVPEEGWVYLLGLSEEARADRHIKFVELLGGKS